MDGQDIRKIAFIDVDGTLTTGLAAWEKVHHFFGVQEQAAKHTKAFFDGKINYDLWAQLDTSLWIGKTREEIQQALLPPELRQGAENGVSLLHEQGYYVVLLSGGIDVHVNEVRRLVKADDAISNELVFNHEGKLIGVKSLVGMKKEKNAIQFMKQRNVNPEHCIAIGDSINDISLFKSCHWSLGIQPTHEEVKHAATVVSYHEDFARAIKELLQVIKEQEEQASMSNILSSSSSTFRYP